MIVPTSILLTSLSSGMDGSDDSGYPSMIAAAIAQHPQTKAGARNVTSIATRLSPPYCVPLSVNASTTATAFAVGVSVSSGLAQARI